jgi:branched-chain amino acid aminotransferase
VAKDLGFKVEERLLDIREVIEAQNSSRLSEAFGSGTAAIISPVGTLCYDDLEYTVANGQVGPITQRLYDELVGIQYGLLPDSRGWIEFVN